MSIFSKDQDEKLRPRPQSRNLAWVLCSIALAPLADAALLLPQLSLTRAQPTAFLVQEGLNRFSSLGAESTLRAVSDGVLFQTSAGAALPSHSVVGKREQAAAHHDPLPKSFWFVQQQVALVVSPVMRIDVTHQALVPELI